MRLDEADVVEQEFVAAGGAELALLEEHADFGRGAVHVVGEHLDDDRHLVRRVALEDNVLHDQLFAADARALFYGAFDEHVARNAFLARLLGRGEEARVEGWVGAAHLGGDHDFADEFDGRAPFFEGGDRAFGMQPLTAHARILTENRRGVQRNEWRVVGDGG